MNQIKITTSHNVEITYELAGIGKRMLAYLIDVLIIGGFVITVYLTYLLVIGLENMTDFEGFMLILLIFVPAVLYHLLFEIFMQGQSIGKRLMKIKVVSLNGEQMSIGGYILRWITRPIDFWLNGVVAILCIVLSKKGQRVGDLAASSTVVRIQQTDEYLSSHSLNQIAKDYTPVFSPMVRQLSEETIIVAKKVIRHAKKEENKLPAFALKKKLHAELGDQGPSDVVEYFEQLIRDYEFYEVTSTEAII